MSNTTIIINVPVQNYGTLATAAALEGMDIGNWLSRKLNTPAPAPAPAELPAIPPAQSMGLFDGVQEDTPLTIPTPANA